MVTGAPAGASVPAGVLLSAVYMGVNVGAGIRGTAGVSHGLSDFPYAIFSTIFYGSI